MSGLDWIHVLLPDQLAVVLECHTDLCQSRWHLHLFTCQKILNWKATFYWWWFSLFRRRCETRSEIFNVNLKLKIKTSFEIHQLEELNKRIVYKLMDFIKFLVAIHRWLFSIQSFNQFLQHFFNLLQMLHFY